jgi:hypothetical protein
MMRRSIFVIVVWMTLAAADRAWAQVEGFVVAGSHGDVNRERFAGVGGGVLLTAKFVSIGAQGDAFFSLPYVAGRFTPFVQGNMLHIAGVRLFLQAGRGWGEIQGAMYGGGVDFRPRGSRVGVRAGVQTYVARMWSGEKRRQSSINVGVIWR